MPSPSRARAEQASQLDRIVLHRVRVPLLEPFVAAHGREDDREVVIVEAVGPDGLSGWGECSTLSRPTYTAEYTDGAWVSLRDRLGPAVLSGAPVSHAGAPMAWTGLSVALADLSLRREGRSFASVLVGRRTEVPSTAVIGMRRDLDDLIDTVTTRVAEGHRSVKVKIAPGTDEVVLAEVQRAFPDLSLAADANGSYRLADPAHRDALGLIDDLGLAYVEQPLARDAVDDLARVASSWETPVALDESIADEHDVDRFVATGEAFVLNLKPARVGGFDVAARCAGTASSAGWDVFVGGMLETGVGRAAALAAASWEACTLPTDLGPSSRYFEHDLSEPIPLLPGGVLAVPDGPGIGVTPIPERLDAYRVDTAVLRR